MLRMQVAVPLDDAALRQPLVEERLLLLDRLVEEGARRGGVLLAPGVADEALRLAILARPPGALAGAARVRGVVRDHLGALMEGDEAAHEPLDDARAARPRRRACGRACGRPAGVAS